MSTAEEARLINLHAFYGFRVVAKHPLYLNSSTSFTRSLTLMACLTGLNVAARIVLAGGPPNVKPVAFLCITAGIIGSPVTGFVVGLMTMLISDIYFGAGYWTIINSASMAFIGFLAGLLWNRRVNIARTELAVGGFLLTAIYDIATSVIPAWIFGYSWWIAVLLLYVPFLAGFGVVYPFGFVHELTTAVLMVAIGPTLISRVGQLVSHNARI
jgi:energy-coupling factor transport system substrate-specific component